MENSRNQNRRKSPFIPIEYGSSSLPTVIGSPSNLPQIITTFASLPADMDSSRTTPSMEFASSSRTQPRLDQTITDPVTNDTYLLNLEIGSFANGCGHVYRAFHSKCSPENGILSRSGNVTLKILNIDHYESESRQLWWQGNRGITYIPYRNIIGSKGIFWTESLLCIVLPYMSEGSLRSILSSRPTKKLPEEFIYVVLKEVVIGLRDQLHIEHNPRAHKTLNAGDIFVHIDDATQEVSIKLAFEASLYDSEIPNQASSPSPFLNPKYISSWGAAPEVFETENENNSQPKSDIWLLGITALELAYGNLPVTNRGDLNYIIKKITKKMELPKSLKKMMNKGDGKFKKVIKWVKPKKKAFSREFEEVVLVCLREDPQNRPTASQLLNAPFFTCANDRFKQFILNGRN